MNAKSVLFVLIFLYELCFALNGTLMSNGWYKMKKKANRISLQKVESINPSVVNSSKYLRISGVIPELPPGAIRDLQQLEDLAMPLCGIQDLYPGAFKNVPQLSRINLKENGIKAIRKGVFNNLNISVIFLNKNEINYIDGEAFDDMPKLAKIKLNSNKINSWNNNWFTNTPSLKTIYMRRNLIKEIPENSFKNMANKKRVDLYFSKNFISKIKAGSFSGLKNIGYVYFDRNNLYDIDEAAFHGVENIHELSFSHNNISELPEKLFENFKTVKVLQVTRNRRLKCPHPDVVKVVEVIYADDVKAFNCECMEKLSKNPGFNMDISLFCAGSENLNILTNKSLI